MAKKGTYSAMAQQTAPVDFGAVTGQILGGVERTRETKLKEKLAKQAREKEDKRYAEQLRKQAYDDVVDMLKESEDMLNFDASGMFAPVAAEMMNVYGKKNADRMREYQGATWERKAQLRVEMQRDKAVAGKFRTMTDGMNKVFTAYEQGVKNGTLDPYDNAGRLSGIIKALKSAKTQGFKKVGEGRYKWGDNVEITGFGTADVNMKITGKDGELLANNSVEQVTNSLMGGFKPHQNTGKFINDVSADVAKNLPIKKTVDPTDTSVTWAERVDQTKALDQARSRLKTQMTPQMLDALIRDEWGINEGEVIDNLAKEILRQQKLSYEESYKTNSTIAGANRRKKLVNRAGLVTNVTEGKREAIDMIKGGNWTENELKGRLKEIRMSGTIANVTVDFGTSQYAATETFKYDLSNPQQLRLYQFKINEAASSRAGLGGTIDFEGMPLPNKYQIDYTQPGIFAKQEEYDYTTVTEELADIDFDQEKKADRTAAYNEAKTKLNELTDTTNKILAGSGYHIKLNPASGWRNKYELTITKGGKSIDTLSGIFSKGEEGLKEVLDRVQKVKDMAAEEKPAETETTETKETENPLDRT